MVGFRDPRPVITGVCRECGGVLWECWNDGRCARGVRLLTYRCQSCGADSWVRLLPGRPWLGAGGGGRDGAPRAGWARPALPALS